VLWKAVGLVYFPIGSFNLVPGISVIKSLVSIGDTPRNDYRSAFTSLNTPSSFRVTLYNYINQKIPA
jgi:hypothetical protein